MEEDMWTWRKWGRNEENRSRKRICGLGGNAEEMKRIEVGRGYVDLEEMSEMQDEMRKRICGLGGNVSLQEIGRKRRGGKQMRRVGSGNETWRKYLGGN